MFLWCKVSITRMFSLLLSRAYTASRLFCFSHQQQGSWGCIRGWEGTQPGQLIPTDQRDISCLIHKAGKKKGRVIVFVFPSHCREWWGPALCIMAEQLPAHRKQGMNSLFCSCVCHGLGTVFSSLAFPLKPCTTHPIPLPHPTMGWR